MASSKHNFPHPLFQEAQLGAMDEKFSKTDLHSKQEVAAAVQVVNEVNGATLSSGGLAQFQHLSGRLNTLHTNVTIDSIFDRAQELKNCRECAPQEIPALRAAIGSIWKNSSLSCENSHFLRVASAILAELSTKKGEIAEVPSTLREVESAMQERQNENGQERAEAAFELLDTAVLFYQGRVEEALERAEILAAQYELPSISHKSSADQIADFIQQAVITSFRISRQDGYSPSATEIFELLEEAAHLA